MTSVVSGLPRPETLTEVPGDAIYVRPLGIVRGGAADALVQAGHALPMHGDGAAFTSVEMIVRRATGVDRFVAAVTAFDPWRRIIHTALRETIDAQLERIAQHPKPFAGLDLSHPRIMGIVNVTPDSFSDGGDHATTEAAIAHGIALAEAGADILDVGGESTRPGAAPVSPEEEQARAIPVVAALAQRGLTVSIDTRHSTTMAAALEAGAAIVNDVTALTGDPDSLSVVAEKRCPVVLMHMQGEPQTMQKDPVYQWAPLDVFDFLAERVAACRTAGLSPDQIAVDPGIGFGKTDIHNLDILQSLTLLHGSGCPILLGTSRKSFIGRLTQTSDPKDRLPGSVASVVAAAHQGVQMFRVHDVAATRQALTVIDAIEQSPGRDF